MLLRYSTSAALLLTSSLVRAAPLIARQTGKNPKCPYQPEYFPHQWDLMPDGSIFGPVDESVTAPLSGTAGATAHQFQSDCTTLGINIPPASCGLPYAAMKSKGNKRVCSGMAATNLAPCGSCVELSFEGRTSHVRVMGNHGPGEGWDISIDNLKELKPPELYPESFPATHDPLSGAGTSGIASLQWKVVDGAACDQHWDGRCYANIPESLTCDASGTREKYGCH